MLIPHVVRAADLTPLNLEQVDTGTTNAFELRLKPVSATGAAPQNTPQTAPAAPTVPPAGGAANGVAPGNTVAAAAANAMAAMHQEAMSPGLPVNLQLVGPPVTPKVGTSFQVAVNLSGGHDVFSVPMQLQYDQNKMTLINVDSGSFLASDGQSVALVHRDDGSGGVAISASRPPGVGGVSGAGPVCILTFQAKAAGDASISITRPGAKNSTQQSLPVIGSQTTVHIQ
jgi:general secretion pathway protein D